MNLAFAIFWLIVAAGIFWSGDRRFTLPVGGGLSGGWLALLLAVYNLVRWWGARSFRRQQRLTQQSLAEQVRRRHADEHREPPQSPDPNLDFTDPPPPATGEHHPG